MVIFYSCMHFLYIIIFKPIDIDECSSSPCGHMCTNTVGSFVCSCNDGYVLDSDQLSCNGTLFCICY